MSGSTAIARNAVVTAFSAFAPHAGDVRATQRVIFSSCLTRRSINLQSLALVTVRIKGVRWIQAVAMGRDLEASAVQQSRPRVLDSHLHVWASEEEVSQQCSFKFLLFQKVWSS